MKPWALFFFAVLSAAPAAAEVELQKVRWQLISRKAAGAKPETREIDTLALAPGKTIKGRLVARLSFLNRGPAEQGVLLRYSLRARTAPLGEPGKAGWAVPFMIEEKRVPTAAANQFVEVPLDPTVLLNLYLKKLARQLYEPTELKLEVMVEPRRGGKEPLKVIEASLPVRP